MLISLKTLIDETDEDSELKPFLYSFSCSYDKDIEDFLYYRAVEFERLSKSRTYIVCDQNELLTKDISEITIYGYISLALKILTVPEWVSNRARKEIDGFSAKIHGDKISNFTCYLIGQLARNSKIKKELLSGCELLSFAKDVIAVSVDAVGGRYMMIECRDSIKLVNFYKSNGFDETSRIPDGDRNMVQMIRKI